MIVEKIKKHWIVVTVLAFVGLVTFLFNTYETAQDISDEYDNYRRSFTGKAFNDPGFGLRETKNFEEFLSNNVGEIVSLDVDFVRLYMEWASYCDVEDDNWQIPVGLEDTTDCFPLFYMSFDSESAVFITRNQERVYKIRGKYFIRSTLAGHTATYHLDEQQ